MQKLTVWSLVAIGTGAVALAGYTGVYLLAFKDKGAVMQQAMAETGDNVQVKLARLEDLINGYHAVMLEQDEVARAQLASANQRVSRIEARLFAIETAHRGHRSGGDEADVTATTGVDATEAEHGEKRPGEMEVAEWIEARISEGVNSTWSAEAKKQAEQSFDESTGIVVADMGCSEEMCRARLMRNDGEKPTIDDFLGEPPFVTDGFTIEESDGTLVVYFAQPGIDWEEVRSEAEEYVRMEQQWWE